MTAQAYYKGEKIVRIFSGATTAVADLPLENCTDEAADASLKSIGLRRTTKWTEADWGREARVRFSR